MKYVYGPVFSRRLKNSLGISTVPSKVCSLDCVYCQLKHTTRLTTERKNYISVEEIIEEVRNFFRYKPKDKRIDYVTFSGSGEPTLHRSIGSLIKRVKSISSVPVALITNGTTLLDLKVQKDLLSLDLIVPSLDAVTQRIFKKIDRPPAGMKIKDIIESLVYFRRKFKGKFWLEIMLVRGINDTPAYLKKMKKVVDRIKPDRIQINSPVRPPSEKWVKPVSFATLKKAKKIFGPISEIV
jgi:wyosine [tRNA(Phe)-imidazoG37] synthetase (radical SAM superfamily)